MRSAAAVALRWATLGARRAGRPACACRRCWPARRRGAVRCAVLMKPRGARLVRHRVTVDSAPPITITADTRRSSQRVTNPSCGEHEVETPMLEELDRGLTLKVVEKTSRPSGAESSSCETHSTTRVQNLRGSSVQARSQYHAGNGVLRAIPCGHRPVTVLLEYCGHSVRVAPSWCRKMRQDTRSDARGNRRSPAVSGVDNNNPG